MQKRIVEVVVALGSDFPKWQLARIAVVGVAVVQVAVVLSDQWFSSFHEPWPPLCLTGECLIYRDTWVMQYHGKAT